jgi:hypothetical protein
MLSPEFFVSAPVNRLTFTAMITFAGLWTYFDDFGRGEDEAALIKAAVWPRRRSQTEAKVAADLDAIAAEELICRYQVDGTPLIHSPSWDEHQKISHKTPSKLPPCPVHEPDDHAAYLRLHPPRLHSLRNGSGMEREPLGSGSRPPPDLLRASRASGKGLRLQDCKKAGRAVQDRCKQLLSN